MVVLFFEHREGFEPEIFLWRGYKTAPAEAWLFQQTLFTIHDSVVTTVENEKFVTKIMDEELTKCIGVKPKLVSEYWGSELLAKQLEELGLS